MKAIKIFFGCFFGLGAVNGSLQFLWTAPRLLGNGNPVGVSYLLGNLVGILMCVALSILLFKSALKRPVPVEAAVPKETPPQL